MRQPRPGRRLSPDEAELWACVARTVQPFAPAPAKPAPVVVEPLPPATKRPRGRIPAPLPPPPAPVQARPLDRNGLDSTWDRQLAKGSLAPDFTLDLHGASLDAAHARLDHGLALALAQKARLVLVVTGRPRPHDPADRASRRGAIRAKFLDWLAAGPHAGRIAAIRPAHPRHGGAGALYVVLRRPRA